MPRSPGATRPAPAPHRLRQAHCRLKEEPTTLKDLSAQYGISRERVRQIEVRAFEKLQKAMKGMEAEQAQEAARAALPPG